jgi:DNA-binding IclR family transcriptional regulator
VKSVPTPGRLPVARAAISRFPGAVSRDLMADEELGSPSIDRSSKLARGLLTLEALADGPKTAAEVARVLGVNRSSALRILQELRLLGYAARDISSKRYSAVSARIYPLLSNSLDHVDWSEVVDPILARLRDDLGEATVLGVPANGTMVYMAFFPSPHPITVRERLGTIRPMHCSALGKAYLSALDASSLDVELGRLAYEGGTDRAPRGPIELRGQLSLAREQGYAVDQGETFDGGSCVATPCHIGQALIGAVAVSGPSTRLPEARLHEVGRLLVTEIQKIGSQP